MVFSGGSDSSSENSSSAYGVINVDIKASPYVPGTTVKNSIYFDVNVQIFNCIRPVLENLLNTLESEILNKVDTILSQFSGQYEDNNPANFLISTSGFGSVHINVTPTRLLAGTGDPNYIVYGVNLSLVSCNRLKLSRFLNGIKAEVMGKVDNTLL
jgi:hypothetical protein